MRCFSYKEGVTTNKTQVPVATSQLPGVISCPCVQIESVADKGKAEAQNVNPDECYVINSSNNMQALVAASQLPGVGVAGIKQRLTSDSEGAFKI